MKNIPVDQLRQMFALDVTTGELTWRERPSPDGGVKVGARAGTINKRGYRQISIRGTLYYAHRIVFAMHNGRWPENGVDHIDGMFDNNAPSNLREATQQENTRNTRGHRDSKVKLKGVCPRPNGTFRAQIKVGTRRVVLGDFADAATAHNAYADAAKENFGEFARVK